MAKRILTEKLCPKCEQVLPASSFYPHIRHSTGLSCRCRSCLLVQRESQREQRQAYGRTYYHQNRERALEKGRAYRESCRETVRERLRLHRQRERQANPERVRARARDYYRRNSLLISLRTRLIKAFNAYTTTGKLASAKAYGVDFFAIIRHLGPCPGPRKEWHIDHIRPLVSFDFNDPEQVRQAFAPENHQWLPARLNLIKHDKYERA